MNDTEREKYWEAIDERLFDLDDEEIQKIAKAIKWAMEFLPSISDGLIRERLAIKLQEASISLFEAITPVLKELVNGDDAEIDQPWNEREKENEANQPPASAEGNPPASGIRYGVFSEDPHLSWRP